MRGKRVGALYGPRIRSARLAQVGHIWVVPTPIGRSRREGEPGASGGRGARCGRRRSGVCGVVGTNVRNWRVWEGVVKEGDDLLVELLVFGRVLGQTTQEREGFRELRRSAFSTCARAEHQREAYHVSAVVDGAVIEDEFLHGSICL